MQRRGGTARDSTVSLSFSGSHFLPPPPTTPTRGKLKETRHTKKAIYLASHFLDLLSNYFSYLCFSESFPIPAQCPSASSGREAWAMLSLLTAEPSWAQRWGVRGRSQESGLENAKARRLSGSDELVDRAAESPEGSFTSMETWGPAPTVSGSMGLG